MLLIKTLSVVMASGTVTRPQVPITPALCGVTGETASAFCAILIYHHPSEHLRVEGEWLDELDSRTREKWDGSTTRQA